MSKQIVYNEMIMENNGKLLIMFPIILERIIRIEYSMTSSYRQLLIYRIVSQFVGRAWQSTKTPQNKNITVVKQLSAV